MSKLIWALKMCWGGAEAVHYGHI